MSYFDPVLVFYLFKDQVTPHGFSLDEPKYLNIK